jgi:hypothetical protein
VEIESGGAVVRVNADISETDIAACCARRMIPPSARALLQAAAADFRKGLEGLISSVRDAGADPFDGSLMFFRAKRADRIEIV